MDVLETFFVNDMVDYAPEEEKEQRRDRARAEIIRYNRKDSGSIPSADDDFPEPMELGEPNSDGSFPGLEDGFVG